MSKFNRRQSVSETVRNAPGATVNYEGGLAYEPDQKTKLVQMAATSLVGENKFYQSGENADSELISLVHAVAQKDPEFILKLAVYSREVLNLRSAPVLLIVELANSGVKGVPGSRKYVERVIQRVDEITEMLGYQLVRNRAEPRDTKLPMLIKNGVKKAFESGKFDEYQFAKYNREGEVTLKDAIFMTHPRPKDKQQQALFNKIVEGTLETPETWETYISANGSNHDSWTYMAPKLPIFALVRNLRNLIQHDVDTSLYIGKLTNKKAIERSRMFPFRFYSAWKMVGELRGSNYDQFKIKEVQDALSKAIEISTSNIPKLPGKTLVLADVSWSMKGNPVSGNSVLKSYDLATLFAAIAHKISDNAIVMAIANNISVMDPFGDDIFQNQATMQRQEQITGIGGQTNVYKAFEYLRQSNTKVDRVILLSDMQCYDSRSGSGQCDKSVAEEWEKYKRTINPNVKFYPIDLVGYGQSVVPENDKNTSLIAGWSEQIFKYIDMFEKGFGTMVDDIENYEVD